MCFVGMPEYYRNIISCQPLKENYQIAKRY